jgi:hypothetical protein
MQPAPGRPGLHSGLDSFSFNANSSLSTAGSILRHNQCLSSKYGALQPEHCAVPVRRSLPRSPGRRASNSGRNALLIEYKTTAVASTREGVGLGCLLLVVGDWRGFVRIDRWLLAGRSWGLAVPFSELALEVGHVGLVGELVQVTVREPRSGGDSLRDSLGTRIERAVHVGAAHGKQALHVCDEVFGLG